jgi:hypothetical protein
VQQVLAMMANGGWHTGSSHVELAKQWRVSVDAVEKVASVASKVLQHVVLSDPAALRAQMAASLEDIKRRALERKGYTLGGDEYENPDLKAATSAILGRAQLLRLIGPGALDDAMGPAWDRMSDDERWARVDEAKARIAAVEATLPPRKALTE